MWFYCALPCLGHEPKKERGLLAEQTDGGTYLQAKVTKLWPAVKTHLSNLRWSGIGKLVA